MISTETPLQNYAFKKKKRKLAKWNLTVQTFSWGFSRMGRRKSSSTGGQQIPAKHVRPQRSRQHVARRLSCLCEGLKSSMSWKDESAEGTFIKNNKKKNNNNKQIPASTLISPHWSCSWRRFRLFRLSFSVSLNICTNTGMKLNI